MILDGGPRACFSIALSARQRAAAKGLVPTAIRRCADRTRKRCQRNTYGTIVVVDDDGASDAIAGWQTEALDATPTPTSKLHLKAYCAARLL